VDPVTHTLVGVTVANAVFRRRAGGAAVAILAIASNLPDLDGVVHLTGDPAAVIMRRTFGHSLFLLPLWCLALAWILRHGRWRRFTFGEILGMVGIGAGLHLFFDLINSFGVVLFWPLFGFRPELSWVFIIDFVLTGLLALPLVLAIAPRFRSRLEAMSRASITAVAVYLTLCGAGHSRAVDLLKAAEAGGTEAGVVVSDEGAASEGGGGDEATDLGPDWVEAGPAREPDFLYVFPEPLGPHRWRGVARTGDQYRVYLINVLTGRLVLRDTPITRASDPRVAKVRATPQGRRVEAFFKAPVWNVGPNPGEARVYDLRFRTLVLNRPAVFQFVVGQTSLRAYP
jgi:membrane-bound metal-dependent hydrolase YbcI (DUF457 family)